MRLLLDTHVMAWARLEPRRLSADARVALDDTGNEIWLSPITVCEILILAETGRLTLQPDALSWIRTTLRDVGPTEAPLTSEVAMRSRSVGVDHRDPADRFLAATAEVYDLTLVTADANLLCCTDYASLRA